jgi:hypothetical protein
MIDVGALADEPRTPQDWLRPPAAVTDKVVMRLHFG